MFLSRILSEERSASYSRFPEIIKTNSVHLLTVTYSFVVIRLSTRMSLLSINPPQKILQLWVMIEATETCMDCMIRPPLSWARMLARKDLIDRKMPYFLLWAAT
jgi:hypothetical protein